MNENEEIKSTGNTFEENEKYLYADTHKKNAINKLDSLLSYYMEQEDYKKVHLLSFWFEDFTLYNLSEKSFEPKLLKKYKRGSIIKANLGFNVGNEEGGLHYCIVLDKNNAISSGTLTVVPLTSVKENKKYNELVTVNLGNEIYLNLTKICANMAKDLSQKYEDIWKLPSEKVEQFNNDFKYIKKVEKEISKMKKGSVALVSQITTISKQRIYDPKTNSDVLAKLKVSGNTLDLIDEKIKELFLK